MSSIPEINVLSYIVQNPDEYAAIQPIFQDTEFQFKNPVVELVHRAIRDSYNRYELIPTQEQLKSWLYTKRAFAEDAGKAGTICKLIDMAYTADMDGIDKALVLGEVLGRQSTAMSERWLKVDAHNFDEEAAWFEKRLDVLRIISQKDRGTWAFPLDDKWIEDPDKALATYLGNPIPLSAWPRITHWLSGGIRRGELVLPAALPGDGKTMFLVTLAAMLIKDGYRVYFAQLDNTFEEVIAKIWACLLQCSTDDLLLETNETKYKLAYLRKKYPDIHRLLVVRKWPRGTKTIKDMRRDMKLFEKMLRPYDLAKGVPEKAAGKFDVAMGDYIDVFASTKTFSEARFNLDDTMKAAAGMCEEEEVAGIFPSQLNRTAKFIEVPDIDNLAEAFNKSHHAAVIPMLYGSKLERIQGMMNIFWAKTRRPREKFVTPMRRDTFFQTFSENEDLDIHYLESSSGGAIPKTDGAKKKAEGEKAVRLVKPKELPAIEPPEGAF